MNNAERIDRELISDNTKPLVLRYRAALRETSFCPPMFENGCFEYEVGLLYTQSDENR
jgi:hypothetical protein